MSKQIDSSSSWVPSLTSGLGPLWLNPTASTSSINRGAPGQRVRRTAVEGDLAHARDDCKSRLHDPLRPNSVDQPFGGVLALSRTPLDNGGHATQCDSLLDFVPVLTSDPVQGGSATGVSQGLACARGPTRAAPFERSCLPESKGDSQRAESGATMNRFSLIGSTEG